MSGPAAPAARLHQLHRLHRLRTGLGLLQRPAAGSSTASSPILLEVFGRRTLRLGAYWRIANLVHLAWLRGVGEATLDGNLYLSCPAAHRPGAPTACSYSCCLAWLRGVGGAPLDGNLYLSCPAARQIRLPQHAPREQAKTTYLLLPKKYQNISNNRIENWCCYRERRELSRWVEHARALDESADFLYVYYNHIYYLNYGHKHSHTRRLLWDGDIPHWP